MDNGINKIILLVEDEMIIALRKKSALEKYGYEVKVANTGEEAIELTEMTSFINLILMDIDLGDGIDGIQTAEVILKYRDVPIVFMSSYEEAEVATRTVKITSYGYVIKNSSTTRLDDVIKMAFKLFEAKKLLES